MSDNAKGLTEALGGVIGAAQALGVVTHIEWTSGSAKVERARMLLHEATASAISTVEALIATAVAAERERSLMPTEPGATERRPLVTDAGIPIGRLAVMAMPPRCVHGATPPTACEHCSRVTVVAEREVEG